MGLQILKTTEIAYDIWFGKVVLIKIPYTNRTTTLRYLVLHAECMRQGQERGQASAPTTYDPYNTAALKGG